MCVCDSRRSEEKRVRARLGGSIERVWRTRGLPLTFFIGVRVVSGA